MADAVMMIGVEAVTTTIVLVVEVEVDLEEAVPVGEVLEGVGIVIAVVLPKAEEGTMIKSRVRGVSDCLLSSFLMNLRTNKHLQQLKKTALS